MIKLKRLNKFLDVPKSQGAHHINIEVCKSVSHFNWFARYNTRLDEKKWPEDMRLKSFQNHKEDPFILNK
jgi:hypothetical protein